MPLPEPIPDLLKAVNDASSRGFGMWVSFLSVSAYLAIAVGTTTHLQLLVEGPVKLPLLGVDLPLFAFYLFAPPLFLLLHLYVLMQLYLLTRSVRQFDEELRAAAMIDADRARVRGQLDVFVLTRLLLGGPDRFIPRVFLRATVWLTLVAGPVVLLLFFELRFLPYHSEETTWVHRAVLLLDLFLLWVVWPWLLHGTALTRRTRRVRSGLAVGASVLALFAVCIATIPDEWIANGQPPWWPTSTLFDGTVDEARNSTSAPFSRNLVVTNVSLTGLDDDQVEKRHRTISLRGRDLRRAILWRTDLRKADLSYTDLRSAELFRAALCSANLSVADLTEAILEGADLSVADLTKANLTGAKLSDAKLRDAKLGQAHLTGATLDGGDLNGADLTGADLRDAFLTNTDLSRAIMTSTDLSRANLNSANLARADLRFAILTGAHLPFAILTGVDLTFAHLTDSNLTGANLSGAQMTSTDLSRADLTGANLTNAKLGSAWAAILAGADLTRADLTSADGLSQRQLDQACGTGVRLPPGLTVKPCPPKNPP